MFDIERRIKTKKLKNKVLCNKSKEKLRYLIVCSLYFLTTSMHIFCIFLNKMNS